MNVDDLRHGFSPNGNGVFSNDPVFDKKDRDVPFYFPLITLMQRECQPPKFLRIVTNEYPVLQIMLLTFWPFLMHKPTNWEELLINIFFFGTLSENRLTLFASTIVVDVVAFFSAFMLLLVSLIYYFRKAAIKPLLYVSNTLMHMLNPLLMIPLGFHLGDLISRYSRSKDSTFIALIIITGILWIAHLFMMIVMYFYDTYSIYTSDSFFMAYDGHFQASVIMFPSFVMFISFVFPLINEKLKYAVIVIHSIGSIIFIYWLFHLPFGVPQINISNAAFLAGTLVEDAICYTSLNNSWIRYPIYIAVAAVLMVIMNFIFRKIYFKRILAKKWQNVSECFFILRVSLMLRDSLFIEGNLIEYLSQNATEQNDRIELARYLCYFPEFQPLFIAQMTMLRRPHNLSFSAQFILYQLKRIEVGRQKFARVDELNEISAQSSFIILQIRTIWFKMLTTSGGGTSKNDNSDAKISLFRDIEALSRLITQTHHRYGELVSQYPSNSLLAEEYSRFLIECEGDFINASDFHTKSSLIQEGKIFAYDDAVIHFLRAYPHFASRVLPKSNLTHLDEVEPQAKLDLLGSIVKFPQLRVEMQRATSDYYLMPIYLYLGVSVLSALFIFVYWISSISLMLNTFQNNLENVRLILLCSKISAQVATTCLPAIFEASSIPLINTMPTREQMKQVAGNDRIVEERFVINMSKPYIESVSEMSENGIIMLNEIHQKMLQQIYKGNPLQSILDVFFNNTVPMTYYITDSLSHQTSSNLQAEFISFFSTLRKIGWQDGYMWASENDVFNAAGAGSVILDMMDVVLSEFLKNDKLIFQKVNNKMWYNFVIIGVVYFVISFVLPWIFYIMIISHFSRVQSKIMLFPEAIKEKGASPIVTTSSTSSICNLPDENNDKKKRYNSTSRDFTLKLMILATLISLVILFLIIELKIRYSNTENDFLNIESLVHNTSLRSSHSLELIFSMMSANLVLFIKPHLKDKYTERLKRSIKNFAEIQESCNSADFGHGKNADKINIIRSASKCSGEKWLYNSTRHELLACLSTDAAINQFIDLANINAKSVHSSSLFKTEEFILFLELGNSHLYFDLSEISEILYDSSSSLGDDFMFFLSVIASISIILSLIVFEINIISFNSFRKCHQLLIAFISRIPPQDIAANTELTDMMLNINSKAQSVLTPLQKIVFDSNLPVLFINRDLLIEAVNASFGIVFGYEANYINCQRIDVVIDDASTISYLESLKFWTKSSGNVLSNVRCLKENRNAYNYDITLVPIFQNNNSKDLIATALIFYDQSCFQSAMNRYQRMKEFNENIIKHTYNPKITKNKKANLCLISTSSKILASQVISPSSSSSSSSSSTSSSSSFSSYAICLVKLQGFQTEISASRDIMLRQTLYDQFFEIMNIYSLLSFVQVKNGIFTVFASGSIDPTDLVIECLNFAFTISNYFENESTWGNFSAAVDVGSDLSFELTDNPKTGPKLMIFGNLVEKAEEILMLCPMGKVSVSERAYQSAAQHDLTFNKFVGKNSKNNELFYFVEYNRGENPNQNESLPSSDNVVVVDIYQSKGIRKQNSAPSQISESRIKRRKSIPD